MHILYAYAVGTHTHTYMQWLYSGADLLLPVVRQRQVVVSPLVFFKVIHEGVQVWKVSVQINFSGVPSTHQVAIEFRTLLTQRENSKLLLGCLYPSTAIEMCFRDMNS